MRPARCSGLLYSGYFYRGHPKFNNFWLQTSLGLLSGWEQGRECRHTDSRMKAAYFRSVGDELCLAKATKNRRATDLIVRAGVLTREMAGCFRCCFEWSVHGEHGLGPLPIRKISGSKEPVVDVNCCLRRNTLRLLRFHIFTNAPVWPAKFEVELGLDTASSINRSHDVYGSCARCFKVWHAQSRVQILVPWWSSLQGPKRW